jgi:DNA phosphorothioation-dependent restriction protein DptH
LSQHSLLIFGKSGAGKTYAIQSLLCELSKYGQNYLIVDYINGFLPKYLESEFTVKNYSDWEENRLKNHA